MRSDNYPFYRKKIPAHSIMCSEMMNPAITSLVMMQERIDFPNMTKIIRSIARDQLAHWSMALKHRYFTLD